MCTLDAILDGMHMSFAVRTKTPAAKLVPAVVLGGGIDAVGSGDGGVQQLHSPARLSQILQLSLQSTQRRSKKPLAKLWFTECSCSCACGS